MDRKPAQLSGGQRQRVAIGRALVREPEVFLFDEPLSNLDALLRVQMRIELAKLHKTLGTTMIYVTHDQVEAMTLADRIVVLDRGSIAQIGAPLELYARPDNKFVASLHRLADHELSCASPRIAADGRDITLAFQRPVVTSRQACSRSARNALGQRRAAACRDRHPPGTHRHLRSLRPARTPRRSGATRRAARQPDDRLRGDAGRADRRRGKRRAPIRVDDTVGLVFDAARTHLFGRDGRVL